jgi:methylmalonyl-CoA/ethylmalonyl-CoA epimerase
MDFDHAGVATDDADGLAALYTDLLSCDRVHDERFDGIDVVFLNVGGSYLELLEPAEDGPIASYLADNGPGIHHVALATADIEGALDRARAHDVDLIDEEPRPGAWGHEVAFLHPGDTGGILVEFVQH